jgi:hypothetical protein
MRRSLAQYHDCLEGQQVQYSPRMPTNSGIHFSATIALASSREAPAAGSRLRDRKASRRLTADLPSRRITQVNARVPLRQDHVDAPAVTERLHKIRCGVGAAMRAVTGNRPPGRQRFHCALMGVKGCGARCRFTPSNVGHLLATSFATQSIQEDHTAAPSSR